MLQTDRIKIIDEIKGKPELRKSTKKLSYKTDRAKSYDVFEIPLDAIIFNSLNGRIGSFRNAYEKQFGKDTLNAELPEHEAKIIDAIWNQRKNDNENTKKSIEKEGQLEPGVITSDGIIIDGNRRAMCLKKIDPQGYFLAAILPDQLSDERNAIRRLETQLQMGRDAIVDYDTTAKYLRAKEFKEEDGESLEQIAIHFRELTSSGKPDKAEIQKWLNILEQMEKYQSRQGYSGYYDNLADQKMEGHFVDLNNYKRKYKNKTATVINWQHDNSDISDMEEVFEDFARAGIPVAEVRHISNPADTSNTGIFNYKDLWPQFREKYEKIVDSYKEDSFEKMLENNNNAITAQDLMIKRDTNFQEAVSDEFRDLLISFKTKRDIKKNADKPVKLLHEALDTLEEIDKKNARYEDKHEAQLAFDRIRAIIETLENNLSEE
tara:strand:- start:285 stop:1586 length:1302 start_codon:yes stop_codon:yes gene_type:complete